MQINILSSFHLPEFVNVLCYWLCTRHCHWIDQHCSIFMFCFVTRTHMY